MTELSPESRMPLRHPFPDRQYFNKPPPSKQPSLSSLSKAISPIYMHQRMPQSSRSSRSVIEFQEHVNSNHEPPTLQATVKKQRYFEQSTDESIKTQYYERQIQNLKSIISDLISDSSRKERIKSLERENQVLRQNYDKLKQTCLVYKHQLDHHRKKQDEQTNMTEQLHKRIHNLQKQLYECDRINKERQQNIIDNFVENQTQMESDLVEMKNTIKMLISQQKTKKPAFELYELNLMKNNIEETAQDYKMQIDRKNQELKEALDQLVNLKHILSQLNIDEIQKEMKKAKQIEVTNGRLRQENTKLHIQIVSLRNEISSLKTDGQFLNSHISLLRHEKQGMIEEVTSLKKAIEGYLVKDHKSNSQEIEIKLMPESFTDRSVEMENFKEALQRFSKKLDRLCEQLFKDLESLKKV